MKKVGVEHPPDKIYSANFFFNPNGEFEFLSQRHHILADFRVDDLGKLLRMLERFFKK